jgi:hypothetical protein
MSASIARTGLGRAVAGALAAAALAGAGCASRPAITPDGDTALAGRIFEPGPSEDRFVTDRGETVVRTRTAPDDAGRWMSLTDGPGERTRLTLERRSDGTVVLHKLESNGRLIECDPALEIEPGPGRAGLSHATDCRLDGDAGGASAVMGPDPDLGPGFVTLGLEFEVGPVTVRRRFRWRLDAESGIAEERAVLRVTVLGVPVRSWTRSMTRQP